MTCARVVEWHRLMSESGTNRTNRDVRSTVAIEGKADMARRTLFGRD
jgi:hypothetical protein